MGLALLLHSSMLVYGIVQLIWDFPCFLIEDVLMQSLSVKIAGKI